jgi:small subunit ribosomal protein S16
MLVIRMQRTGRKGHAMFRVVVQDSRRTPTSGKIVAQLGSYDPHSKAVTLNKEKAQYYLDHGAQPSDRATGLLKSEGIKLPKWVTVSEAQKRSVRNADKRRSTRPAEEVVEETAPAAPEAEVPEAEPEAPVAEEAPAEETPAEEVEPAEAEASAETADETSKEA